MNTTLLPARIFETLVEMLIFAKLFARFVFGKGVETTDNSSRCSGFYFFNVPHIRFYFSINDLGAVEDYRCRLLVGSIQYVTQVGLGGILWTTTYNNNPAVYFQHSSCTVCISRSR